MPRQVANTILSLAPHYQQEVEREDYEIILVENRSNNLFEARSMARNVPNLRYYLRRESFPTPVNAINYGAKRARGRYLAIMIDGARLVTPGIVRRSLECLEITDNATVGVPGYHLGSQVQQESSLQGYDEVREQQLLQSILWPDNGYRLFEIACLSKSCEHGLSAPLPESNWLALSRSRYFSLGGYEPGFNSHGGGYANHDMWRRACEAPEANTFVLAGEGCFHQYHGGATTDARGKDMRQLLDELHAQYKSIRGKDFSPPDRPFTIKGDMPAQVG